jgi:hypothetical protein
MIPPVVDEIGWMGSFWCLQSISFGFITVTMAAVLEIDLTATLDRISISANRAFQCLGSAPDGGLAWPA